MHCSRIIIVSILALCGVSVLIGLKVCKYNPHIHQKADNPTEEISLDYKPDDSHQMLVLTENQHILETNEYVLDTWEKLKTLTKIDFSGVAIQKILYLKDEEYDGSTLIVVFNDVSHEISKYYRNRSLYDPEAVNVSSGFVELFSHFNIDTNNIVDQSIDFAEVVHKYSYTPFEAALKFGEEIQDIDPDTLNGYEYVPYPIEWFQIETETGDENCMIVVTYPYAIKVGGVFLDYVGYSL